MARKMVDRGLAWLGAIPASWGIDRIASLFSLRNERVSDDDFAPLSVTMKGVVPQLSHVAKSDDHSSRKLVRKGDFAINSRSDRRNSCGFALQDGSVSLINIVCTPRAELDSRYYGYLFDSNQWADEFYSYGHGIVADLWTTGWSEMKKIVFPVPPMGEQERIADYLDAKCAEIDKAIIAAEASIEEYKAYRQAVITSKVFGFGRRTTSMSDYSWVKRIPSEYKVAALKAFSTFGRGNQVTKADLLDSGKAIINYGQIHSKRNTGVHLSNELIRYVSEGLVDGKTVLRNGDVLFATTSEDREALGAAVFVDADLEIYPGSDSMVCRFRGIEHPKYLAYQFLTGIWRDQLRTITNGIKVFHVTQNRLSKTEVVLPPVDVQKQITDYLDAKCAEIAAVIESKQAIINDLKAYKQSLIYEVVTGKREV